MAREDPILIDKTEVILAAPRVGGDLFEGYKTALTKFAKDNRIPLASNL